MTRFIRTARRMAMPLHRFVLSLSYMLQAGRLIGDMKPVVIYSREGSARLAGLLASRWGRRFRVMDYRTVITPTPAPAPRMHHESRRRGTPSLLRHTGFVRVGSVVPLRAIGNRVRARWRRLSYRGCRLLLRATIKTGRWLARPLHRPCLAVSYRQQAARITLDIRPEYIHCHDLHTLWAGYFARRRLPKSTFIYDSHEIERHRAQIRPRPLDRWLAARYESFLIRHVDKVIVACDSAAEYLAETYRISQPAVVRNCPDHDLSHRAASTAAPVKAITSLPPHSVKLLYVGGIVPYRGLEQAIQALAHLPGRYILVLLGKGGDEYVTSLRQLATSVEVEDRVCCAGFVDRARVISSASRADLGLCLIQNVSLSYFFTLPNKLFEYMGAGLPVVASNFPELSKVVLGHGLGVVCAPDRPREIAGCIQDFVESGAYLAAGERARRAFPLYTWAHEKARLLSVYGNPAGVGEGYP